MKRSALRTALVLVLWTMSGAGPTEARELYRRGEFAVDVSGSLKQILLYTKQTSADDFEEQVASHPVLCGLPLTFPNCPAFDTVGETEVVQSLTRLRLALEIEATSWLRAVLVYDNEVFAGHIDTLEASIANELDRSSFLGAEGILVRGENVEWGNTLYRGYIQAETKHIDITLGRQRIAWGVGRLWNPIDRFNPIPPLAIESDQSTGVDAIDAKWLFDGFSYLQAVAAPGHDGIPGRYALRLAGVYRDTDWSLMGGVFEDAPTVGFDFARNVYDATLRMEVVYTDPQADVWPVGEASPRELDDFWQVVLSLDRNFDIGTGLYALVEYLYNGNALGFGRGKAGPLLPLFEQRADPPFVAPTQGAVFGTSSVVTRSAHQLGISFGMDVTPELRADLLTLVDMSGGSAAFFPSIGYVPLDLLELRLGAQFFAGPRLSEYGDASTLVFFQAEVFF